MTTTMTDLYLGHPRELVDLAVVLPDAHFVQLDDWLFDRHGLGPRYARVRTQHYRGHRALSYAYLDLPATTFELITEHEQPIDLGAYEDLATDERLVERLTATCIDRSDHFPSRQQLALAPALAPNPVPARRFTRLTNAFSKKLEMHFAAVALHYFYYNFVQIHGTLRVTPAMAAGVSDRVWEVADIISLL